MSILELTMGIGAAMVIALSGLIQINVQSEVFRQQRNMAFYVNEAPRVSRAIQSLVSRGTDLTVHASKQGGAGKETGSAVRIRAINPVTGAKVDSWVAYNPTYEAVEYVNSKGNSWYLGTKISKMDFTLNPDGTLTLYLQHTGEEAERGPAIEVVLERR